MIVADTNVWIAYWKQEISTDTELLDKALLGQNTWMAPMVVSELLSDPALGIRERSVLINLPLLEIASGFWIRVGELRARFLARQMRPKLVDSMIAQVCIDYGATLVTRDLGFHRFVESGLRLHKQKARDFRRGDPVPSVDRKR
jgi:predicted nucleic acid-binding protein